MIYTTTPSHYISADFTPIVETNAAYISGQSGTADPLVLRSRCERLSAGSA